MEPDGRNSKGPSTEALYWLAMVTKRTPPKKVPRATRRASPRREPNIWEKIEAIGKSIPRSERAKIPTDAARNLDHYLYGAPKQED